MPLQGQEVESMRATLVAVLALLTFVPSAFAVDEVNTSKFRQHVTVGGIMAHERALQSIANANGGTRASGTPGFDASADYVAGRLKKAGYKVTRQEFIFPFFQKLAPPTLSKVSPAPAKDYETDTYQYSGSGDVTAPVEPVDVVVPIGDNEPSTSNSGCEEDDFDGFTAGNVALMQRGTCDFAVKAENAEKAGASAAIIFNEGQPGRTDLLAGTLGGNVRGIPVLGLSYADGAELVESARKEETTVHAFASTLNEDRPTSNVIGETKKGDASHTLVVGSHLDSVVDGPGINDDGSGTATDLEIAETLAKDKIKPRNKVRFAFWGAEESGLLGSTHYVENLSPDQVGDLFANLNFDMVASPNYVRFVYDGDSSDAASGQIETLFNNYYAGQGMQTEPTPFDGRSDYGPFLDVGVPAGGLFSGAENVKTPEQAAIYGGTAGEPYDACYHQACDDIHNLSTKALFELGDGAAHAVLTLAKTKTGFFEDGSRVAKPKKKSVKSLRFANHRKR
jgi:Zn-dependent M28 family amino/carboxypeptidase